MLRPVENSLHIDDPSLVAVALAGLSDIGKGVAHHNVLDANCWTGCVGQPTLGCYIIPSTREKASALYQVTHLLGRT